MKGKQRSIPVRESWRRTSAPNWLEAGYASECSREGEGYAPVCADRVDADAGYLVRFLVAAGFVDFAFVDGATRAAGFFELPFARPWIACEFFAVLAWA